VAIGDVSGEGSPDLAVGNASAATVSVLLGNGAGSFGAKTDFATGNQPLSVAIGDVSGEGSRDLVVANFGSGTVSVFLGTGAGAFGTKTDFATGIFPRGVALADLNGDGMRDIVTANAGGPSVSVLLGAGGGGFNAKTDFPVGTNPRSVAIADVNGDGRLDVATANNDDITISVLLGNGAGGLGERFDFATAPSPNFVAIGDVSNDGRLDIATSNADSNFPTTSVLLGLVPTRTAIVPSPNPASLGSPITLTATVSIPAPGYGTVTDSVRFFDGTTLIGSALVVGGVAQLAMVAPRLGDRAITAVYRGNGRLFGSISAPSVHHVLAPVSVDVPAVAPLALTLEGVRPNPTMASRMVISFALPTDGDARLELIDVKGRVIASRDVGGLGAGRHVVDLVRERKLAAGVYLVRLTQGAQQRTTRAVVLE
jgi:hypothetical protein